MWTSLVLHKSLLDIKESSCKVYCSLKCTILSNKEKTNLPSKEYLAWISLHHSLVNGPYHCSQIPPIDLHFHFYAFQPKLWQQHLLQGKAKAFRFPQVPYCPLKVGWSSFSSWVTRWRSKVWLISLFLDMVDKEIWAQFALNQSPRTLSQLQQMCRKCMSWPAHWNLALVWRVCKDSHISSI